MSEEQERSPDPEPETRRLPAGVIALLVVAAAAAAAIGIWWLSAPAPTREAPVAATPAPVAAPAPVASAPAAPETTPAPKPRPARKTGTPLPAAPAAPAAPTTGELHIDSDVPGAMVFLDRNFIGNAPATATGVEPGTHQLKVAAEGYDSYDKALEVAVGPADVMVRFKEIRLDEKVDVVHKHTFGSCEGRLVADPQGVRYETSNKGDAFSMKFAEIDTFTVDYLKKNLVIKKRGGKQYNFTTKAANADPLFVFHRNVDKVRQQVAGAAKK